MDVVAGEDAGDGRVWASFIWMGDTVIWYKKRVPEEGEVKVFHGEQAHSIICANEIEKALFA
jgi:hypothetical protein